MSFAFLPLYTGDYQRDTLHLSMLEHGAYLKLLMYCWDQQGPAPDDDRKLAGICNARSKEEVTAVRAILEEFFVLMEDGWYNRRLQKELAAADDLYRQAIERGRRSASVRAAKYGTAQPGAAETLSKGSRNAFETLSKGSRNALERHLKGTRKAPESVPNPSPSPSPSPSQNPKKANQGGGAPNPSQAAAPK